MRLRRLVAAALIALAIAFAIPPKTASGPVPSWCETCFESSPDWLCYAWGCDWLW